VDEKLEVSKKENIKILLGKVNMSGEK